jgi:phosphohistidine phosphatase
MLLLLVRHANAGDHDPSRWPDDRDRPLTDKGRKTHRRVSRLLGRLDYIPSLVLTSPWLRAAQTAEILVETLELVHPPVPCEALAADPDAARLAECVGDQGPDATVAMVGHSPWMEELAALLLGGSVSGLRIAFPKSGVMGIDLEKLEPGAGELRFFLRPGMAEK